MTTATGTNDADDAMARHARGEAGAFGDLFDALAPRLCDHLNSQIRDAASVERAVQETLLHLHRARGTFVTGCSVWEWAVTLAEGFVRVPSPGRGRGSGPLSVLRRALPGASVAKGG